MSRMFLLEKGDRVTLRSATLKEIHFPNMQAFLDKFPHQALKLFCGFVKPDVVRCW